MSKRGRVARADVGDPPAEPDGAEVKIILKSEPAEVLEAAEGDK